MSEHNEKQMHRGMVVVGAILIQLCLGAIYAWSVFTPPLKASQPADVAAIYANPKLKSAPQLGLDATKFQAMNADLQKPNSELKRISAEIKGSTDAIKTKVLSAEKAVLTKTVNAIVLKHVSKDKIDALSYGFSNVQTQAIFAAGLAAFAIIMVLAGRMMPKIGPRNLTIAGGVVLGAGYVLAGLLGDGSFWSTFVFVGVIGGSGIGLAYVVPIAVGMKWFPDKKGMISGLAVAGFGFGALLWIYLAGNPGNLIASLGLNKTFMIFGIVFFLTCIVGSIWMKNPPEGWKPAGWNPPEANNNSAKPVAGTVNFTSGEMLRKPQFYMIFLCFVFGAGAGLMSIGLMKLFPMKAMMAGGLDWAEASAAASMAMAVFFSLANGIGRIAWGTLSDKLGRKASIILMLGTQGIIVILFQWMAGTPAMLYLGAALIGFNFGGNFALFPTITADTFGTKYIGQNYGWVFLSYGVGGICGPLLGGALGDKGNFPMAFTICGVLCLVAAGIAAAITHPKKAVA